MPLFFFLGPQCVRASYKNQAQMRYDCSPSYRGLKEIKTTDIFLIIYLHKLYINSEGAKCVFV